jgi:hypothetical protein
MIEWTDSYITEVMTEANERLYVGWDYKGNYVYSSLNRQEVVEALIQLANKLNNLAG